MNVDVGDYVRTKYGIAKIIDLKENPYGENTIYVLDKKIIDVYECEGGELALCNPLIETMQDKFDTKFGDEKLIIKSSPNIIDILEVGDYVDGYKVEEIERKKNGDFYIDMGDGCWLDQRNIANNPIESIITHEQMEAMEYKIEK